MDKRDAFAGCALQGLLGSSAEGLYDHVDIAREAYAFADAMMALSHSTTEPVRRAPPADGRSRSKPRGDSGDPVIMRFGNCKGTAIQDLETQDLQWYIKCHRESVENPDKRRFKDDNQRVLELLQEELLNRGAAGDDDEGFDNGGMGSDDDPLPF
jgi:hypothetical protein